MSDKGSRGLATSIANTSRFVIVDNRNALIFLMSLSILCGAALGNPPLLALGEVFLVILVVGWWNQRGMLDDVEADREHYARAFEGDRVGVLVRLKTDRKRPVYLLEVEDSFPAAAEERVRHLLREPFDARRHYELHYEKRCVRRRGPYMLGPIRLRAADPMGLFLRGGIVPTFSNLLVYPQARELPELGVLDGGTLFHVGQETTARPGQSEEFVGLRDYRPGDPPLHVHWPSSARHDRLIVKEFQETVVTEVTLLIDLSRMGHTGVGDQTSTELIIRAAASIAARAIELSHMVCVHASAEEDDFVPFGGGRQHLTAILDRMAVYRANGQEPFADVWERLAPLARRGSTLVAVFSAAAIDLEKADRVIRELALSNIHVIAVPIDDRSFIKLIGGQETLHAQAAPFEEIAEQLRMAGADVYPLRPKEDLARAFSKQVGPPLAGSR